MTAMTRDDGDLGDVGDLVVPGCLHLSTKKRRFP
jgi:hypothetical protein